MHLDVGEQIDEYTIVRRLGQGGMGTVYQASDAQGRFVALKVPADLPLDDGMRRRFKRELEVMRSLDHPGVQRLIATGTTRGAGGAGDSDVPYAVLEWVDGTLLRKRLCTGRPLPLDEALRAAIQLCDVLHYCHERGIVHRDVKPDNVLVARNGSIKLIDFGAALVRRAGEDAGSPPSAVVAAVVGTPDYMSPEQVQGLPGDRRSDVYALGMVLYEMATGEPPYHGDNALAVMAQHVFSRPAPLRARNRQAPPALEAIVAKAAQYDPDERYQSMNALGDALRSVLGSVAASAQPPPNGGWLRSLRRHAWPPRHLKPLTLLLIGVGVLLLVGVALIRGASRAP